MTDEGKLNKRFTVGDGPDIYNLEDPKTGTENEIDVAKCVFCQGIFEPPAVG